MKITLVETKTGWAVYYYRDRIKHYLYRGTDRRKATAIQRLQQKNIKEYGLAALGWTPQRLRDVGAALEILQDRPEISLSDAAEDYVQRHPLRGSMSLDEAIDSFLGDCDSRELRPRTYGSYESKLRALCRAFPGASVADLTPDALRDWIANMGVGKLTKRNYCRELGTFLAFCQAQNPPWIAENPIKAVGKKLPKAGGYHEIGFLRVSELQRLLEAAPDSYKGVFAVLAFTGIRRAEAERVRGAQVMVDRRCIDILPDKSKTGNPRFIERAPECLWPWVESNPIPKDECLIPSQGRYQRALQIARDRAGIQVWPSNAFRHGFASHYYAATDRNIGLVMDIMGHQGNQAIFHNFYKGKVSREEGLAFCEIKPE